ncbi:polysaccharide pyruvyl transferase family protein [Salipiger abyssi]|uniref:polysaccharide pyruvyl transferase family protein n=1 Tax=Salipiger abyssi TaxID=1250539 RepID=UPI00405A081B
MVREQSPAIRCMNVKYSPNLGDGLLSECLEAALVGHGADREGTWSVDLAARGAYGESMAGRGTVMTVLDALPAPLRQLAVRLPLAVHSRRKWQPHYETGLSGAQAVAIGGGNLLSDQDLNFPTKLALALRCARAGDLPAAFYACGMAGHWTREGDRRLRRAIAEHAPAAVFLRDAASKARWDSRFASEAGCDAVVVRDPGLMARDLYGPVQKTAGKGPRIGLGLMSHVAIRYHAEARIGSDELMRWYVDLARALLARGARVVAFNNGAPEDVATANALAPQMGALGVEMVRPQVPADLSAIVGGCDAIVAYRMHAVIAAYSHAVPALALSWDDKLDAFMDSVDRADWLADPSDLAAEAAADRALTAAQEGVDPARHAQVLAEARADVGRLYATLAGRAPVARA